MIDQAMVNGWGTSWPPELYADTTSLAKQSGYNQEQIIL